LLEEKEFKSRGDSAEEAITTQYQKLSGTKLTGQTIDLSQFNKPKRKKEEPKITLISPVAGAANKNKRKRIASKPSTLRPPEFLVHLILIRLRQMLVVVVLMPIEAQDRFVRGNRPAIVAKVEPTEEDVKTKFVKL
jgi:translation initiation factor IF-2